MITKTVRKFIQDLLPDPVEQEQFENALCSKKTKAPAIVWLKERIVQQGIKIVDPASWQPDFVDRLAENERVGDTELHNKGYIYCLDLSSVFASMSFSVIKNQNMVVFDVCASPGGKAVLAARFLTPQLLCCNETIRKRCSQLISNLKRCEVKNTIVTSFDSAILAEQYPQTADLVIVDAPCSGQSLVGKGKDSFNCFHPSIINMNSNRQRRITANSLKLLSPGGYFAYMTCTFSIKENEAIIKWLLKQYPNLEPVSIPVLSDYQSQYADFPCYRLWPHQGFGAGAFTALLHDTRSGERHLNSSDFSEGRVVWKNLSG